MELYKVNKESTAGQIGSDRKKKSFSCEICHYGFASKKDVKRHIKTVHEGKKPFKCNLPM